MTSLPESASSQIQRSANLKLEDDGTLEGTVNVTFTGLEGRSRRTSQRNEDDEARTKFLEDEFKSYIPVAVEANLTNKPDWNDTEPPLVAEFHVKIPGWVSSAGRRAIFPVGLFSAPEKPIFAHADRTYAICFDYPYQKKDDVSVELPAGWTVSSVPTSLDRDAKAAEYVLKVEDNKKAVHISRTVRSDLFVVPQPTYPALRTFFQAVRSGDDEQIVLQPAGVAAAL